jgi:hypothetical protein
VDEFKPFDDRALLEGYVAEATWFWFDASTVEKSFEVGLHRLAATCIREEIHRRGLTEPEAALVYRRARRVFPPDDLRSWKERDPGHGLAAFPGPGW